MSHLVMVVTDLEVREQAREFEDLASAVSFALDLADRKKRLGDVSCVRKVEIRNPDRLELSISAIQRPPTTPCASEGA